MNSQIDSGIGGQDISKGQVYVNLRKVGQPIGVTLGWMLDNEDFARLSFDCSLVIDPDAAFELQVFNVTGEKAAVNQFASFVRAVRATEWVDIVEVCEADSTPSGCSYLAIVLGYVKDELIKALSLSHHDHIDLLQVKVTL